MTDLNSIRTAGRKQVPHDTLIKLRPGAFPATVTVNLRLPGQVKPRLFENLPIVDGEVTLPVPLVFVCHAKEDEGFVESTADRLWQDGFITWLDKTDLLPGDDWKTKIEDAIERADRVIVFLSERSVKKIGFVQREIKYAFEQRQLRPSGERYIIPALIQECDVSREFRDIHWLPLWGDGWYETLNRSLAI